MTDDGATALLIADDSEGEITLSKVTMLEQSSGADGVHTTIDDAISVDVLYKPPSENPVSR